MGVFLLATQLCYLLSSLRPQAASYLFFFVAISGPLVPLLRKSILAGAFLDGVVVASLSLMAVVALHLGRNAVIDLPTALMGAASAVLLIRYRVNSFWLVVGGALIGLLLHMVRT